MEQKRPFPKTTNEKTKQTGEYNRMYTHPGIIQPSDEAFVKNNRYSSQLRPKIEHNKIDFPAEACCPQRTPRFADPHKFNFIRWDLRINRASINSTKDSLFTLHRNN